MATNMRFEYDDGGRQAAGYRGQPYDCVTRAIAIAASMPYQEAYALVNEFCKEFSPRSPFKYGNDSARRGVGKKTVKRIIESGLGWQWHPTMFIGSGCKVHLRDGELPLGRLIVNASHHLTCVIDGVIHDTHDPSRNGNRCVYGYWTLKED